MIIGAAFGTIVSSLTDDIDMPAVGAVFGGLDFSNDFVRLGGIPAGFEGRPDNYADLKAAGVAVLGWGNFVSVVINFLILGLRNLSARSPGQPPHAAVAGFAQSDRGRPACRDQGRAEGAKRKGLSRAAMARALEHRLTSADNWYLAGACSCRLRFRCIGGWRDQAAIGAIIYPAGVR